MIALWNLLFFIVLIGILVTVHEYGHFIVARKCGVKVLRFSIGFGKPLISWRDKQGTEYVIALIPLGGYVKMLDARMDNVSESDREYAFNYKPVGQRIAIVAAGPIFNFLLAIVAFWLMFIIGVTSVKPIIGNVADDSIAANAGLTTQQQIVAINGEKTVTWQSVQLELSSAIGKQSTVVQVQDNAASKPIAKTLDLTNWQPKPESESLLTSIGIAPFSTKILPEVFLVADDAPASGKLEKGDIIRFIDEQEINEWSQVDQLIKSNPGESLPFAVERNAQLVELYIKLGVRNNAKGEPEGFLGIVPTREPLPDNYIQLEQYGPFSAVSQALERTWRTITLSFAMVGKLITGDVSLNALSGPVSIAQGAGATASYGVVHFLSFMAFISVNLGIINLLPLPVLDGGHLLYYLIELFSGKPVPEKVQEMGFRFGMMVLLGLMGIAILNDISRL